MPYDHKLRKLYTTRDLQAAFEAGQKDADTDGYFHWLSSFWPDYTQGRTIDE